MNGEPVVPSSLAAAVRTAESFRASGGPEASGTAQLFAALAALLQPSSSSSTTSTAGLVGPAAISPGTKGLGGARGEKTRLVPEALEPAAAVRTMAFLRQLHRDLPLLMTQVVAPDFLGPDVVLRGQLDEPLARGRRQYLELMVRGRP